MEKELVEVCEIEKEFAPIIGYKSIKNEMIKICDIMRNRDFYSKLGVSVPNGLLLSGDPGLGKTLMANCFIKASGRNAFTCRKDKPDGEFVNYIKVAKKGGKEGIWDNKFQNNPFQKGKNVVYLKGN